MAEIQSCKR